MNGVGDLTIEVKNESKKILIDISDTGKGVPKRDFKKIFYPGFTTKERGWGMGLSLVKRIIEEYIRNQLEEDHASDQISIKEYMDPFTGSKKK